MSLRTLITRWIPVLCLSALVLSCDRAGEGLLDPGEIPGPNNEIFDGSSLAAPGFEDVNPHFFFLPPLVKDPGATGVFDPGVTVEVDVIECTLANPNGGSTALTAEGRRICYLPKETPVAEFRMSGTGELVTVSEADQAYQVNWHTDLSNIDTGGSLFYRIAVFSVRGGSRSALGHVDVMFGENGSAVKNINQNGAEFVGLKDGRTLPVKFRIEEFAATFAQQSTCHDESGSIIDCDVRTLDPDATEEQQLVVWAESEGHTEPAGVVTFTPGSVPEGVVAVIKYTSPTGSGISDEIPDDYEIPPFLTVELFDEAGDLYTTPLGGDGARLAWCHEVWDDSQDPVEGMEKYAIYKVDPTGAGPGSKTVLLETGPGADCEYAAFAYAPQPEQDGSFFGMLRDGLSKVASVLKRQPLRAMHGGLNTEGPIKRFSDFGAVDLDAAASVGAGAIGVATDITVTLFQAPELPVGGDGGAAYVGASADEGDNLVVVEIVDGPNFNNSDPLANILPVSFDASTGDYTATYTPAFPGTDYLTVTVNTLVPQEIQLTSQVYGHSSCLVEGIIDCAVELLDQPGADQQLVVWVVGSSEPAGAVTFSPNSVPADVTAVLKYVQPDSPNYPPSPEIPNIYEIPPFLTVELYQGQTLYNADLGGEGAELLWCHDVAGVEPVMNDYAIYKVDPIGAGPDRQTVLLATGPGADCGLLQQASVPQPEQDGSLLGMLRYGLDKVAAALKPEPLRAMHGGLNTEGPIKRFSDFGAVDLDAAASVDDGAIGVATDITVTLFQAPELPVGGDAGAAYVGASADEGDNLVVVEIVDGANYNSTDPLANILPVSFDASTGDYTATYTPAFPGTDYLTVTVNTLVPQVIPLQSQVTQFDFVINGDFEDALGLSSGWDMVVAETGNFSKYVEGNLVNHYATVRVGDGPISSACTQNFTAIDQMGQMQRDHVLELDFRVNPALSDATEDPACGNGWDDVEIDLAVWQAPFGTSPNRALILGYVKVTYNATTDELSGNLTAYDMSDDPNPPYLQSWTASFSPVDFSGPVQAGPLALSTVGAGPTAGWMHLALDLSQSTFGWLPNVFTARVTVRHADHGYTGQDFQSVDADNVSASAASGG